MTWNWEQPDWPNWRFDPKALAKFEEEFLLNSGRLIGAWQHLSSADQDEAKVELLSDEALKTSAIEGEILDRESVKSSVRRQFGLAADRRAGPAESGIAELMVACFRSFSEPLSHETLSLWHRLVCRGRTDLDVVGGYRTHAEAMQIISNPYAEQPSIHFEAPPSTAVSDEMSRFLKWFATHMPGGNSPLAPLTRAGLAHLYFVSIHPFEDGNGRIGRALSEKALAEGLNQPSLLALSRQIEKTRKAYYAALEQNNRTMEVSDWLVWFADTCLEAQDYSIALIDHLIAKTRMLDRLRGALNARQEKALVRMFNAGPEGFLGGLSAKNYIAITGAAAATARRDLADLIQKGALTRTGERKGTRYWLNLQTVEK